MSLGTGSRGSHARQEFVSARLACGRPLEYASPAARAPPQLDIASRVSPRAPRNLGRGAKRRSPRSAKLRVCLVRRLLGRIVPARQRHAAREVVAYDRPGLLVAVEPGGVAQAADDHQRPGTRSFALPRSPPVHLVVDRCAPASVVFAHAVDVLRRATPNVLAQGLFADPALAETLRAELGPSSAARSAERRRRHRRAGEAAQLEGLHQWCRPGRSRGRAAPRCSRAGSTAGSRSTSGAIGRRGRARSRPVVIPGV